MDATTLCRLTIGHLGALIRSGDMLSDLPACMVPCGISPAGLPIGLPISGKPFDEATVLRVAQAYERVANWHQQRPALP